MSYCVLFVDDEPNVLAALQRALHAAPFQVLVAGSADQAAALLRERPVDVIVSDEQMPGTSGIELLAAVAERHPDTISHSADRAPDACQCRARDQRRESPQVPNQAPATKRGWSGRFGAPWSAVTRLRRALPPLPSAPTAIRSWNAPSSSGVFVRLPPWMRVTNHGAHARSWNETPLFAEQEDCGRWAVRHSSMTLHRTRSERNHCGMSAALVRSARSSTPCPAPQAASVLDLTGGWLVRPIGDPFDTPSRDCSCRIHNPKRVIGDFFPSLHAFRPIECGRIKATIADGISCGIQRVVPRLDAVELSELRGRRGQRDSSARRGSLRGTSHTRHGAVPGAGDDS